MGCVYIATNKTNKKSYIGKTIGLLESRKYHHEFDSENGNVKRSHYFHKAIRKYGSDNFEWGILFESENDNELCEKEKYYIKLYNSHGTEGYNLTDGGEGTVGFIYSDESKQRMRKKQIEISNRPESKERMSKTIRRYLEENPDHIEKMKAGTRKKLYALWATEEYRKYQHDRSSGGNNPAAVKIICIETNEIFECIKDAADKYNKSATAIRLVLDKPIRKSKNALHFMRYDTWLDENKRCEYIKKMEESLKPHPPIIHYKTSTCELCNKEFSYSRARPSQLNVRFCSRSCAQKAKWSCSRKTTASIDE
jgi:group I intron endonuclease